MAGEASPEIIAAICALVLCSAMFSGLTLGLMGLDKMYLEITIASGSESEQRYAKMIQPVRANGNFLLCTLLVGNVAVNSLSSILMADLTSGFLGFVISTATILILGEIIPQAVCTRYALAIGAYSVWLVKLFMVLTGPVSYPLSKLLDVLVGVEITQLLTRNELKTLVQIHAVQKGLEPIENTMIQGALDLCRTTVADAMVPLAAIASLSVDTKLDDVALSQLVEWGFSHVPVFDGLPSNVVGMLHLKTLAILSPDDSTALRKLISRGRLQYVRRSMPLSYALGQFKEHTIAVVLDDVGPLPENQSGTDSPVRSAKAVGIITLSDVLRKLVPSQLPPRTGVPVVRSRAVSRKSTGELWAASSSSFEESPLKGGFGGGFSNRYGSVRAEKYEQLAMTP